MLRRWCAGPALLAVVLLAPACGSSSGPKAAATTTTAAASSGPTAQLRQDDAAVVGADHVTKGEIAGFVAELIAADRHEHQPVPKPGTAAYRALQEEGVNYFVSSFALEQAARRDFGIAVGPQAVAKSIDQIREHDFGGSTAKMLAHFAKDGITQPQLRIFQRIALAEQELPAKVAARHHVKISTAEARTYYRTHVHSYTIIAPTREIRDVKVSSEQLAQSLYNRIEHGASFASIAAKYSTETGPLAKGRAYNLTEGAIAINLSNVAFGLATGAVSPPTEAQGSWYLIEPVENSFVGTKPFKQVAGSIEHMLAAQKTSGLVKTWIANLAKTSCGDIRYRAAYQPTNTVCGSE